MIYFVFILFAIKNINFKSMKVFPVINILCGFDASHVKGVDFESTWTLLGWA